MKRATRKTHAEWSEIVSEFYRSEESEVAYCERLGMVRSTFRKWRYRMGRGKSVRVGSARRRTESGFIRLVPSVPAPVGEVVISVGDDVRIAVRTPMGIDGVAQLVKAVRDER